MPEMHLSLSAVRRIAKFNGLDPEHTLNRMLKDGIREHYPLKWVCGANRTLPNNYGYPDYAILEDGIKNNGKVTCPKCIEIIKKYGEK